MTMARLEVRVKSLEETQRSLRELPGRMGDLEQRVDAVELQIVQLRAEMRSEFSALREASRRPTGTCASCMRKSSRA